VDVIEYLDNADVIEHIENIPETLCFGDFLIYTRNSQSISGGISFLFGV